MEFFFYRSSMFQEILWGANVDIDSLFRKGKRINLKSLLRNSVFLFDECEYFINIFDKFFKNTSITNLKKQIQKSIEL